MPSITIDQNYDNLIKILIKNNKLSDNDLNKALRMRKSSPDDSVLLLLHKMGLCSETDLAEALCECTDFERAYSSLYPLHSPLPNTISQRFLKHYHVIGLDYDADSFTVAVFDPLDGFVKQSLEAITEKRVLFKVGLMSEIDAALEVQFGAGKSQLDMIVDALDNEDSDHEDLDYLRDLASEAPIIKMVNFILQKAIENRASDIHIEPFDEKLQVRLRIDGVLQDIDAPPVSSSAAVISRVKIMAKLNIAERRLPQDGRIKLQMSGKEIDLRVSTIPTLYGESIVIRLLDKENAVLDFKQLGFVGSQADQFIKTLSKPNGIILITGPTGSGKSTTLYAALKQLHTPGHKIITVEDPIEYQLDGVNQIQAKPQIGLTFANALRSIVRQDPDIIMIGEMRDLETAKIAVQSALTGHLVLSTLHTNGAAAGITRLLDMGLEEYLLTSTINGILAQRLVRVLCPHCKTAFTPDKTLQEELKLAKWQSGPEIVLYKAVGCQACHGIGYKGRLAIIEFLSMSETIRQLVMRHEQATHIQTQAIAEGMTTMYEDGISKALQGLTTIDEIMRVTQET